MMMMDLSPLPASDFSVDDGVEAEVVQPVLADPVVVSAPQQHQEEGQASEEPRVACHPNVFLVVGRERVPVHRVENTHKKRAIKREKKASTCQFLFFIFQSFGRVYRQSSGIFHFH